MPRKRDRPYGLDVTPVNPLDTLFQDGEIAAEFIAIGNIQTRPQPRRYFDPKKQQQLTESVQKHGILEPLIVRPLASGRYELIAGERRYRAAKAAGLSDIPVVIRDLSDDEALQVALIENLQRDDLNPLDETESILQLLAIRLDIAVEDVPALLYQMKNAQEKVHNATQARSEPGEAIAPQSTLHAEAATDLEPNLSPNPDRASIPQPEIPQPEILQTEILQTDESLAKTAPEASPETTDLASRNNVIPKLPTYPNLLSPQEQEIYQVFNELGRMGWLSFTCNRLPLLKLDEQILEALRQGQLAYTKAMAIARIKDINQRRSILQQAINEQLPLSQLRDRIRQLPSITPSQTIPPPSEGNHTIPQRIKTLYHHAKRSPNWKNPSTQKKIDRLLNQLEALLSPQEP